MPPYPLVGYTKLLSCYTKLFYRVVTANQLLHIKIEVFCLLKSTALHSTAYVARSSFVLPFN